ncbi:hypothetical protein [Arthrobacter sp. NPDC058127]|uniref:hypothetical protein n=1 Tax=Arthrobacter sp. NPDC058127 TaxID=3346351 RepID=UPI0036E8CB46
MGILDVPGVTLYHFDGVMAGKIADHTSATAALLNSTFVKTLGPSNGTDDSTWINTTLAAGGAFRGLPGQTYMAKIVLPSNTSLDLTGCRVIHPSGATSGNLITNAAKTPVATASDAAITSGAFTVTTALSSQAVAGQTVVIAGALGNGPLVANVVSVAGSVITLTLAAKATVSAAAISLFTRDKSIKVKGGDWDRQAVAGSGVELHGLMFRHVDDLTVDIDSYRSTAGKYGLNIGDVTNAKLGIGYVDSASDGIHVNGPASNIEITRIAGSSGDDSVALTGNDYAAYADVAGDITDVRVRSFNTSSKTANLFKVLAGSGCTVDKIKAGSISGAPTINAVWIGDDSGQAATTGGTYGSVEIGLIDAVISNTNNNQLRLISPNASTIRASVRFSAAGGYAVGTSGSTTATIGSLVINADIAGAGGVFFANSSTTTIKSLVIDGYVSLTGAGQAVRSELGTIVDLDMRGKFEGASTSFGVRQVSTSARTITNLRLSGSFSGFDSVYRSSPNAQGAAVTLSGKVTSTNRACAFYNGSNTVVLAGCTLDSLALEAFYVSSGSVSVSGSLGLLLTPYSGGLFGRAASESIKANGASIPADFAKLTPSDQDEANNTNAAVGCGVGKAIYSTAAGHWKNLYSGALS